MMLQWKPPKDNGGLPLSYYVVEKRPKSSDVWTKLPDNILPNKTEANATNLDNGQDYHFRAFAVNSVGKSEPLVTTTAIKAKYPFGELIVLHR